MVIAAGLAWFAAGVAGLVVVVVIDLVIIAYVRAPQRGRWRTGRPTGKPRAGSAGDRPDEPDVVSDWFHERLFEDPSDDRG